MLFYVEEKQSSLFFITIASKKKSDSCGPTFPMRKLKRGLVLMRGGRGDCFESRRSSRYQVP